MAVNMSIIRLCKVYFGEMVGRNALIIVGYFQKVISTAVNHKMALTALKFA